ncbi:MAG: acetate--CoA ligase family protein, partial [Myxococcota bacterium]
GPLVLFGLGGIFVEVLRDVALRLCPVRDVDAKDMLASVPARQLLEGARGQAPRDQAALIEVIARVSQLAVTYPEIAELDINPLISLAEGAVAVDARVVLADAAGGLEVGPTR